MIFKLTFNDGQIDWCTAKDQTHLLKSYDYEYDLTLQTIDSLEEISEEESKSIMVINTNYDKNDTEDKPTISLWDLVVGDDFCVIASTEFI